MGAAIELVRSPLRSMRRATVAWAIGLAALVGITIAFWPAFRGSSGISAAIDQLPGGVIQALGLQDFGSPAGFLRGNLYELIVPLLLALAAVSLVSGQTASEEAAGRLELVLAQPVGHRAVFVARELAALMAVVLICLVVAVVQFAFDALVGLEIDATRLASTIVLCGLLACLAGGFAAALAGRSAQPGLILGVSIGFILAAYLVAALFPLSSVLEPWSHLSPWSWAFGGDPLVVPAEAWRYVALAIPAVVFAALGAWAFGNRDVAAA
jgi:ABC-2 type transport system permease protein